MPTHAWEYNLEADVGGELYPGQQKRVESHSDWFHNVVAELAVFSVTLVMRLAFAWVYCQPFLWEQFCYMEPSCQMLDNAGISHANTKG